MADPTTPETVFVRGEGGGILEMDVPTRGHAKERFDEALQRGALVIVPAARWVERGDGSKYLVAVSADGDAAAEKPKRRNSRAAKPSDASADAVEGADDEPDPEA